MNALLKRTRSTVAIGIAVLSVAAVSLARAPTAAACPVDIDRTVCVGTVHLQIASTAKQTHAKHHRKAPVRHAR